MFKKRNKWRRLTTTEKVNVLGFLVLVVTAIIAFFAWLAATESNQQQQEIFLALNQPILELTNIEFISMQDPSADHVRFTIKNTGQSQAYGICVGIYQIAKNGKVIFSNNVLLETCADDYPFGRFSLIQGLESSAILVPTKEVLSRLGYKPSKAVIVTSQPSTDFYLFSLHWKDVVEEEHQNIQLFQLLR